MWENQQGQVQQMKLPDPVKRPILKRPAEKVLCQKKIYKQGFHGLFKTEKEFAAERERRDKVLGYKDSPQQYPANRPARNHLPVRSSLLKQSIHLQVLPMVLHPKELVRAIQTNR